jgi:hypothetical protein
MSSSVAVPCIVSGPGVPFISTAQEFRIIELIANKCINTKSVISIKVKVDLIILKNDVILAITSHPENGLSLLYLVKSDNMEALSF